MLRRRRPRHRGPGRTVVCPSGWNQREELAGPCIPSTKWSKKGTAPLQWHTFAMGTAARVCVMDVRKILIPTTGQGIKKR